MPTKTTEQVDGAEKQTDGAEKQVLDALLGTEEAQAVLEAETEAVLEAETEAVPGEEPPKAYSPEELEAELEKRVAAEADSRAAKSLVTYQETQKALKREIAELKETALREKEEAELARQEGREKEEWGDIPAVGDFQKTRREFNSWMAQVRTAYQGFQDKDMVEAKEAVKSSTALKLAIQYGLPEGGSIVKELEAFVKEISEGKSDAEMELKALRSPLKIKEKKPAVKLDSGRLSAPGGEDLSSLPLDKRMERALEISGRRKK